MKPKIRIAESKDFCKEVFTYLTNFAEVELGDCIKEDLPFIFDNYDIFWFRLGFVIDSNLILNSKRIKIIATPVTGIDHIDEIACEKKCIKIVCLKGESDFLKEIRATAEHTLGLCFALIRKTASAIEHTKLGLWNRDLFRGNEIFGKKVGIIGLGRLGTIVAKYFNALGAHVYFYDIKNVCSEIAQKVDCLTILNHMDIVSIHVNLNSDTVNLISTDFFSGCNPNLFLINTSRGSVVDENALYEALVLKKIKGAALDVINDEYCDKQLNDLLIYSKKNDNLIVTPHIGGNTYESFEKTEMFIAKKIKSAIQFSYDL